ncbi:hypothetical protein [Streptomyces sp. NPDC002825]|uniref:hypothetical protein n=1 Tax=Streptomyces sp. NPDC002825 TaxID=3154666 RepID=UPI0033243DDE
MNAQRKPLGSPLGGPHRLRPRGEDDARNRAGRAPPTANFTEPGEGIDLDVPATARAARPRLALSTSVGFGGHNAALVIAAP